MQSRRPCGVKVHYHNPALTIMYTNHMSTTAPPAAQASSRAPGIYFDEVHRHPVRMTPRQNERLLDIVSAGFDIVTATDVFELATCGDFAAVPALEIVRIVEVCCKWERCCCKRKSTIKRVSAE